ncbi:MAG TPA: D-2-hydroxyacid dehydrogenase [Chloroflexota bacterium]|nr:D-2-hydroxyacid dehydrogenase [Chloroflexota bacterium]
MSGESEQRGETGTPTVTVVVAADLPSPLLEQIRQAAGQTGRVVSAAGEPPPILAEAEVLVAGKLTPAMLHAAPRLRWVHSLGAGVEGLLFPELVSRDVVLTNARGAHRVAMPEYVAMAMLAWTHRLPALVRAQQRREWLRFVPQEVWGKTLGLLGYGEIGRAVARRVAGLGVRCVAYRRHPAREFERELVERVYGPGELHDFLGACDFVVNSLPLTPETRGLLGAPELAAMRQDAVLIHLGRGPTVQADALLAALRQGHPAGAFLDVFDEEPLPPHSPFWELENVVVTSHTSGNSVHYTERSVAIFCENLRRFRAGEPLRNVVDKRLGY